MQIDLNCDLGEGAGNDVGLMKLVSSANIACGGHAGDEATMRETVRVALACGVAIGAHPGFCDRGGFGRREVEMSPIEAGKLIDTQCRALQTIAREEGAELRHVKLHGALYNMAARDALLASNVVDVLSRISPAPIIVCPPGSALERIARQKQKLKTASEVFADRGYQSDGSLIPRNCPGAMIDDAALAAARLIHLLKTGRMRTEDGTELELHADTVCIHGDAPGALSFTLYLKEALARSGVTITSFSRESHATQTLPPD